MKNLWVPLSAAIAQQHKVETIANNVANVNTPGFKKDALVFKEYLTALEEGITDTHLPNEEFSPQDFYHTQGSEHSFVKTDGSYTDFSQGTLMPTGNINEAAIKGSGMFELDAPNGVRYTRVGQFSIDKDSFLVNDQGLKYRNIQGSPIKLTVAPFSINLQGELFQNGSKVDQLSIKEFLRNDRLRKEGSNLYINDQLENIRPTHSSVVHHGFVEGSNVNPMTEMSELIKANRNFESIQRAIKTYDAMEQRAMNDIAKF